MEVDPKSITYGFNQFSDENNNNNDNNYLYFYAYPILFLIAGLKAGNSSVRSGM